MNVELRAPFDRLNNPYLWALLIDAMDVLGWIPYVGEALDFVQGGVALVVFENPMVAIISTSSDLLLPGPLDFLPSTLATVYLMNKGVI